MAQSDTATDDAQFRMGEEQTYNVAFAHFRSIDFLRGAGFGEPIINVRAALSGGKSIFVCGPLEATGRRIERL